MRRRGRQEPIQIAEDFGRALDHDDFDTLKELLDPECVYRIGSQELIGPEAIANSYEQNMIEGRKTLDELLWGESGVEEVGAREFIVHFTDHLKHKGQSFIHRCQQRVVVGGNKLIVNISHVANESEEVRLKEFMNRVGLG